MIVEYDRVYQNIRRGPIGVDTKHYVWQATAALVAVAAEQAAFAIQAPHLSNRLAIAFADVVNSYTDLVLPFYGSDGTLTNSLSDKGLSSRLKDIITHTAGNLSMMNIQRITYAAKLNLNKNPTEVIKNAPITVMLDALNTINPFAPISLPTEELLLQSLQKKVSHPDAAEYQKKIARVVRASYLNARNDSTYDTQSRNTVMLGNRQAALIWQTRLILKAATKKPDGEFDSSLLNDWQFAPYNTMVNNAFREGFKTNNSGIEGVSHALITILQDHAELISEEEWAN